MNEPTREEEQKKSREQAAQPRISISTMGEPHQEEQPYADGSQSEPEPQSEPHPQRQLQQRPYHYQPFQANYAR